jgi:hypothetical protein
MLDHLGVNDIPKAKSLENNDRSTALSVNGAGTSPHICAETVPPTGVERRRACHTLLDTVEARLGHDDRIAGRIRTLRHSLRLQAGGDDSPELSKRITDGLTDLGDVISACTVSSRMEG